MSENDTQLACSFLIDYFTGNIPMPTLTEVCDVAVQYYNSEYHPFDNYVYLLTFPSGKLYMGQTVNLRMRMSDYKRHEKCNLYMKNALNKYGFQNITIEYKKIPAICADAVEIFMILWLNLTNPENGYNLTSGGKSGYVFSDEVRARISVAVAGENNPIWGKPRPDYVKEKISKANSGLTRSEEFRARVSVIQTGKEHTDNTKKKQSMAHIGEKNPNWGKITTDDVKEKMSIAHLGDKNHMAKHVVVEGALYGSAGEASRKEFPDKYNRHVDKFIIKHPDSNRMFYISKEFYKYCNENGIKDVTRNMYNGFEHYMNNLL